MSEPLFLTKKTMRFALLFMFVLIPAAFVKGQTHKGKCGVEIQDVSSVSVLGYLSAYTVMFRNATENSVDGIYFTAVYYNNEDREVGRTEESFNSSSLIDPIAPGVVKSLVRTPAVKGASRTVVTVDRVHFTSGKSCK